MSDWAKRLTPNFTRIIQNLRPSKLGDLLLERGLLDYEDLAYVRSSQHKTEQDRSRVLLTEILLKKETQTFERFCEVLLAVPDQAFIATDILGYKRGKDAVVCKPISEMTSTVSERMLYDVGIEIGKDWKEVAKILGLTSQEIDDIKSENKSSRKRGWKMLKFWHSKVARVLSAEKVYRILLGIKEMNQIRIWKQNETLDATALCPFESTDDNTSSNPDKAMFELAAEVGVLWKDLALDLGIRASELDIMEKEASTIKGRAFKMLRHLHAKTSASPTSILNIDDIKTRLRKIKEKQYDAQLKALILPENVQDDKKLCGREEELGGIFETFWGNRHRLEDIPQFCLQVVNGLGGVGKSSVALKYAIKWKEWYQGGVMLFNAESYSSLHNSVRQNMKCLHLSSADGSLTEDNQTLLQYLYRIGKVLLIYDGADNLDFLESYLPSNTAPIHVLLTTRSGTHSLLDKADSVTSLKRLKTDSAVKALQAWRGRPDEELDGEEAQSAAQLVSEPPLEGLPLPIAHAGRYMAKANLYCSQYYFLLKSRQEKLQALVLDMEKLLHYFQISSLRDTLHRNGIYHPKDLAKRSVEELESVAVNCKGLDRHMLHMAWKFLTTTDFVHLTWQMDIEKVKESDNEAMELLFFASFLASKDIPEKLLCPLVFTDASSYRYAKSLSSLKSHTLVDVSVDNDGYHVDIHPLIQSTVFERLQFYPEKLCHCLDRLCCHILSLLPTTDLDIKQCLKNDSFMALIPHLYATAAKVGISPIVAVSVSLLSFACRSAMILQHVDVAMDLCHQHLKLFSTSKDTQQRFNAFYYMGRAYEMLSNPQAAESHFKNALSVIDTCSADEKTSLFHEYGLVLGRLASCYSDQQMFSKAEHLYLTELKLVRQRPEESRHYIATVLNNLALNYSKSGQIQKALKAYEEVLEILEGDQATPPLSLSTALLNMGHCLLDNGHFARALPLLERCLVISRQNLPVEHLDLANSIRELSMCCLHLNNVQRATELANEALAIASHCLPKDHPKTASYLSQLASCHYNARRLDEAIKVTEQCVRITKQNLPSTRSELCTSLSSLGQLYSEKGTLDEAKKYLEECLTARRSFLPPDHPSIGTTLWNLGAAYEKENDFLKASELLRECLHIRETCLPWTHPDLVDVLGELGDVAFYQGKYDECLRMYGRIRDIYVETSPNSMEMATVCHNMGMCCMKLAELDAAEKSFTEALNMWTALFPRGHDQILIIGQLLREVRQMKLGHYYSTRF